MIQLKQGAADAPCFLLKLLKIVCGCGIIGVKVGRSIAPIHINLNIDRILEG